MEQNSSSQSCEAHPNEPNREELNAELREVPEPPEQPPSIEPPGFEQILASALSYIRGKRGGDLVAVILVGSGARRALTPHSDLDLIALVKGQDEGQEIIRVADRFVEIRNRSVEIAQGTDPFTADSDGDGVNDALDCAPLDSTRSTCVGDPNDHTPPVITLDEPAGAVPIP